MREPVGEKAARLLLERRVLLRSVTAETVQGVVHGDTASYVVSWAAGRWSCTCPSRRPCSHLAAVRRVVTVDLPDES